MFKNGGRMNVLDENTQNTIFQLSSREINFFARKLVHCEC